MVAPKLNSRPDFSLKLQACAPRPFCVSVEYLIGMGSSDLFHVLTRSIDLFLLTCSLSVLHVSSGPFFYFIDQVRNTGMILALHFFLDSIPNLPPNPFILHSKYVLSSHLYHHLLVEATVICGLNNSSSFPASFPPSKCHIDPQLGHFFYSQREFLNINCILSLPCLKLYFDFTSQLE